MAHPGTATLPLLLEAVHRIEPVLRAEAAEAEKNRRLSNPVVDALHDQGLYKIWKPQAFGGFEVDPITAFQVFEEVSRIDSAAGWNVQLAAGAEILGAWFPDEGARESFGETGAVIAGCFFPPRKATAFEGEYIGPRRLQQRLPCGDIDCRPGAHL